ncbi:hypothetical protein CDAR_216041 [Caerostris darwini]|uniref:Uncharacterized protein n=1 Tax=Caerostris darwini TaxID=1538125 RepID=A0AAV4MP44_9ARAC|nr:hypothetical protein CDAR_216041 [Caerostris darwini]
MSWYPRVATRTVLAPSADVSCLERNSFAPLLLPIAAQAFVWLHPVARSLVLIGGKGLGNLGALLEILISEVLIG